MKHSCYIFLLLIIACISTSCIGQSFKRGFYVNQNGDTTTGLVTTLSNGPLFSFSFKKHKDSTPVDIPFASCKSFCIGKKSFISWYGRRNMCYLDKVDQALINIDSGVTGTIPLRQVYKGKKTTLYHFKDQTEHFFIAANDTIQELLILYSYRSDQNWESFTRKINSPTYNVNPVYKTQLTAILDDDSKEFRVWIDATEFNETELKQIVQKFD